MALDTLPPAATADRLTETLRKSGALAAGRVREVVVESSRPTILSRIIRLRLTYENGDGAPGSLILKMTNPDRADLGADAGRREVAFYNNVASGMSARLTPRCHEAHADSHANAWSLLLEDLADSHVIATAWPLPPSYEQCERVLRARARFHAEWWDDPRLGSSLGSWSTREEDETRLREGVKLFNGFIDRNGDRLSRERRGVYERMFASAPRLLARYHTHRNATIIQGDAHVWNAFLPRDSASDDVRFFDWDSWDVDVGTHDLAYMIAMHWYPERRRAMEGPLLDVYHAELLASGVKTYDRQALTDDYRLSVLWQIMTPIWQEAYKIPSVIWWNNLERAFLAVEDLGCRELLR